MPGTQKLHIRTGYPIDFCPDLNILTEESQISALLIHLPHYSQSDEHLKILPHTHPFRDPSRLTAAHGAAWHQQLHSPLAVCPRSPIHPAFLPLPPVTRPVLQPLAVLRACPPLPVTWLFLSRSFLLGVSGGSLKSEGR